MILLKSCFHRFFPTQVIFIASYDFLSTQCLSSFYVFSLIGDYVLCAAMAVVPLGKWSDESVGHGYESRDGQRG